MAKNYDEIDIPNFLNERNNIKTSQKNSVNNKSSKKKTKKKKKKFKIKDKTKKRIKIAFLILLFIGSFVALLLSPLFNVTKVEVINNSKFTKQQIESKLQIPLDTNMFRLNLKNYKEILENESYIETVKISRKLPDCIYIDVTERQPMFQIEFVNSFVYIDKYGYILEISSQKNEDLKILTGLKTTIEKYEPGNKLDDEDVDKLDTVCDILEKAKNNDVLVSINSINIKNSRNYILTVENGDKLVYIGDNSNMNFKMIWLNDLLIKCKGQKGVIYLEKVPEKDPVFAEQS